MGANGDVVTFAMPVIVMILLVNAVFGYLRMRHHNGGGNAVSLDRMKSIINGQKNCQSALNELSGTHREQTVILQEILSVLKEVAKR